MKNSAFEQPARTNSRSLLFRSRRRGRTCRRGSLSGLASYSMAIQSWRVVPKIFTNVLHSQGRPNPFQGMLERCA